MNPKPLVALNHFTVPTGMSASSYLHARTIDLRETRKATCKRHPSAWLGRELPIGYYVVVGVGTNGRIRPLRGGHVRESHRSVRGRPQRVAPPSPPRARPAAPPIPPSRFAS